MKMKILTLPFGLIVSMLAFSFMLKVPQVHAQTSCNYYASPNGTGNGLSPSTPFQIDKFWSVATPGKTLCLLDGTYGEVEVPTTFAGTAAQPITIRALHDGQVLIRGAYALGIKGSYGILEGVNVEGLGGEWTVGVRGDHWVLRRVIAWATSNEPGAPSWDIQGTNNLIEDCAAFGITRKTFSIGALSGNPDRYNTIRRCWVRYENRPEGPSPRTGFEIGYFQSFVTAENLLATWDEVPGANTSGSQTGPLYVSHGHNNRIFGSIIYETATASWPGGDLVGSQSDTQYGDTLYGMRLQDLVAIIAPSNASWSSTSPFALSECDGSICGSDNIATNLVSVGGIASTCGWTHNGSRCGTILHGDSLASALRGTGKTIWEQVPGICYRYVDGTLTSTPLWPWPMNQRIKDALVQSGRTSVDVTQTIEGIFGPIPQACTTGAPPSAGTLAPRNLRVVGAD
jgi:hypothetical protein